jgi:hypothetical protein
MNDSQFPVPPVSAAANGPNVRRTKKRTLRDFGDLKPDDFLLSAKIDFVTIRTTEKVRLPALEGTAIWPKNLNGTVLTVHDATAGDVHALQAFFGSAPLMELEVAVDFRPRPFIPTVDRVPLLQAVFLRQFACELEPSKGEGMVNQFRAFYRRLGPVGINGPFNLRLPLSSDQLLYGGRDDPAQVKCYLKGIDQGKALAASDIVARVEVRLSDALPLHHLGCLEDLLGFKFRKSLAPYFRMVSGTKRHKRTKITGDLRTLMHDLLDRQDNGLWQQTGVGNFVQNGKGRADRVRLIRNCVINDRIGQALHRLEKQFGRNKSVCLAEALAPARSIPAPLAARYG